MMLREGAPGPSNTHLGKLQKRNPKHVGRGWKARCHFGALTLKYLAFLCVFFVIVVCCVCFFFFVRVCVCVPYWCFWGLGWGPGA